MSDAATIARALKAHRAGDGWVARCPAHDDRSPSFSLGVGENGAPLFKCHAGCTQADVIDALRKRGLWSGESSGIRPVRVDPRDLGIYLREKDKARIAARKIWDAAKPAKGTVVEEYLKARGIKVPPPYWSELRFAPRIKHTPSGGHFRAMIARISSPREFCGIQRTYLSVTEPAKADIMPNKMTLGPMECAAVRFGEPDEMMGLAEGVETALSARQLYSIPTWATLSCVRLKQIEIPKTVRFINIFGDPGKAGKAEAFEAAEVYEAKGYRAEIIFPAADFEAGEKADFNTVLWENMAKRYD